MKKKQFLVVSGAVLVALVLAGTIGAAAVFAQDPTPPADTPLPLPGRADWGFGGRDFLGFGDWTMFDTVAEALGLTPVELFTELHAGNSLEDIATEQGVDIEDLQEAMNSARADEMRRAIEQAVEDGTMSEEQAAWMLEGLEGGFLPMMGRGFGRGPGHGGGPPRPAGE